VEDIEDWEERLPAVTLVKVLPPDLANSPALWNRSKLDLNSRETLVQLLDRGTLTDWRALYALAQQDRVLLGRLVDIVETVPLPTAWFWRAALASLGVAVDYERPLPQAEEE
jgi:hypothetical protein